MTGHTTCSGQHCPLRGHKLCKGRVPFQLHSIRLPTWWASGTKHLLHGLLKPAGCPSCCRLNSSSRKEGKGRHGAHLHSPGTVHPPWSKLHPCLHTAGTEGQREAQLQPAMPALPRAHFHPHTGRQTPYLLCTPCPSSHPCRPCCRTGRRCSGQRSRCGGGRTCCRWYCSSSHHSALGSAAPSVPRGR